MQDFIQHRYLYQRFLAGFFALAGTKCYTVRYMHSTKKLVGIAIIAFLAGALMMWFAGGKNPRVIVVEGDANDDTQTMDATDKDKTTSNASGMLEARNQPPGDSVLIDAAILVQNGWVVIHEDRNGQPGNILGARRLGEGSHTGEQVALLRGTVGGLTYYAMLHNEDGDGVFDHTKDLPLRNESNEIIMARFETIASPSGR